MVPTARANQPHYGAFLKRARQVRGLTQTALANASGTSLPTIHAYESKAVFGRGRLHLLAAIVQALHRARALSPNEQSVLLRPLEDGVTFLDADGPTSVAAAAPPAVADLPAEAIGALAVAIERAGVDRVLACLQTIVALTVSPALAPPAPVHAVKVRHPDGVSEYIPRGTLPPHAKPDAHARQGKKAG